MFLDRLYSVVIKVYSTTTRGRAIQMNTYTKRGVVRCRRLVSSDFDFRSESRAVPVLAVLGVPADGRTRMAHLRPQRPTQNQL
jgi:hypothetical protein